jgi:hypothetical protein
MLPRLIFVLLVALNIAVAAWLLFGGGRHFVGDVADDGVPRLKLVAEVRQDTAAAPAAVANIATAPPAPAPAPAPPPPSEAPAPGALLPTTSSANTGQSPAIPSVRLRPPPVTAPAPAADAAPHRTFRCVALGPFATEGDSRAARTALGSLVIRSRSRQETSTLSHGWRVFLPPMATRESANDMARRLAAKNVKDYFVVPAGPEPNSVALGVFNAQENARKRRDEVVALGFPARMAERIETVPSFWLDVVVGDEAKVNWQARARAPKVQARPTGCF